MKSGLLSRNCAMVSSAAAWNISSPLLGEELDGLVADLAGVELTEVSVDRYEVAGG
jgi:hypothetical protein